MRIRLERGEPEQVRELRLRYQLSQKEFAVPIQADEQKVKRWEKNGMPEIQWLLTRITYDPVARNQWLQDVLRYDKQE